MSSWLCSIWKFVTGILGRIIDFVLDVLQKIVGFATEAIKGILEAASDAIFGKGGFTFLVLAAVGLYLVLGSDDDKSDDGMKPRGNMTPPKEVQ